MLKGNKKYLDLYKKSDIEEHLQYEVLRSSALPYIEKCRHFIMLPDVKTKNSLLGNELHKHIYENIVSYIQTSKNIPLQDTLAEEYTIKIKKIIDKIKNKNDFLIGAEIDLYVYLGIHILKGTPDFFAFYNSTLFISDFKSGTRVNESSFSQLTAYALLIVSFFNIKPKKIKLEIFARNKKLSKTISLKDIVLFKDNIQKKIHSSPFTGELESCLDCPKLFVCNLGTKKVIDSTEEFIFTDHKLSDITKFSSKYNKIIKLIKELNRIKDYYSQTTKNLVLKTNIKNNEFKEIAKNFNIKTRKTKIFFRLPKKLKEKYGKLNNPSVNSKVEELQKYIKEKIQFIIEPKPYKKTENHFIDKYDLFIKQETLSESTRNKN